METMKGVDLAKLREQVENFNPKFDKIADRSKISQTTAFKKQCLSKFELIDELEKKKARFSKDIFEYVNHLERYGFAYDDGSKPKVPVAPRRLQSAPVNTEAGDL